MGTNADLFAKQGVLADAEISRITQKTITTAWHDFGLAQGQLMDDAVSNAVPPPPPPPPPPSGKCGWGSSGGAWGTAKMVSTLGIKAGNWVRCFSPAELAAIPAGAHRLYSNDGGHNRGYDLIGVTTMASAAAKSWLAEITTAFPDDCEHVWNCGHEEDIHGSDEAKLGQVFDGMRVVVTAFNKTRKYPVKLGVITTGMVYDDPTAAGYQKWNLKNTDYIITDNYNRRRWDIIGAWATKIGKKWGIGENGIKAQTNPTLYSDDQVLAAMQQDHDQAVGHGCSFFMYWPNGGNTLTARPKSTAQLKTYIAQSLVGV